MVSLSSRAWGWASRKRKGLLPIRRPPLIDVGETHGAQRADATACSFVASIKAELDESKFLKPKAIVLGECIGRGSFGSVYKCQMARAPAACKVITSMKLDDDAQHLLANECKIWSRCAHEHITTFHGLMLKGTSVIMVCEYMPDGSLFQMHERRRCSNAAYPCESELVQNLCQVAAGMEYLHSLEPAVVHRDLKSHNILRAGRRLAISDFGLSRYRCADNTMDMTPETGDVAVDGAHA